jgi:hypothetical protein
MMDGIDGLSSIIFIIAGMAGPAGGALADTIRLMAHRWRRGWIFDGRFLGRDVAAELA